MERIERAEGPTSESSKHQAPNTKHQGRKLMSGNEADWFILTVEALNMATRPYSREGAPSRCTESMISCLRTTIARATNEQVSSALRASCDHTTAQPGGLNQIEMICGTLTCRRADDRPRSPTTEPPISDRQVHDPFVERDRHLPNRIVKIVSTRRPHTNSFKTPLSPPPPLLLGEIFCNWSSTETGI